MNQPARKPRDFQNRSPEDETTRVSHYELALEAGEVGIWEWDLNSSRLTCSAAFRRLMGLPVDFIPTTFQNVLISVLPEERQLVQQALEKAIREKSLYEVDCRIVLDAGKLRWISLKGRPHYDFQGRPVGIYGVSLDVSRQRVLEENLRRAIGAREETLAIVSHDLKTPLTAIVMSAVLLQRAKVESLTTEFVRNKSQTIQRSAERMRQLIDDLLHLSRIDSGTIISDLKQHLAAQLIHDSLELLEPIARAKQISVTSEVTPASADVFCDRERIQQVLANVVGNALKFTPMGGHIDVFAKETNEGVVFSVSDTGPGIASDQIPNIFNRFWQGRDSTKWGTGLGLSIAKGIVEAHGGRIWAESTVGRGSTFYFLLTQKGGTPP